MKEADSVTQLVDDISNFAPKCGTADRQFLHFIPTTTNAGRATGKYKEGGDDNPGSWKCS